MTQAPRPTRFSEMIGQTDLKRRLNISIKAAKARKQALSHLLIDSPPGLGKTTLAGCVANALRVPFYSTIAPSLNSIPDTISFIMQSSGPCVLFIDEIHRLPIKVEEFLHPVLEDFRLEIDSGIPHIDLPNITVIGATTQSGSLSKPLRDRFPLREHIEFYSEQELTELIKVNALKMNLNLDGAVPRFIAGLSRGTPRTVNNHLMWVRDYAHSKHKKQVKLSLVLDAMREKGIDMLGLEHRDRKVLSAIDNFGRPVGINAIASTTSIYKETIEYEIEPTLLYLGLISRTSRGRCLTDKGTEIVERGK